MGAAISKAPAGGDLKPGLGDVPEKCVAEVLLHLSPPEICRLAKLNRTFRGAASADFVWELKLPENYRYLFEKLFGEIPENWAKKDIYARLCRPNPFDGGMKEFWLEKRSGRACMLISSKALSITGIDDRRYWNFIPTEESSKKASWNIIFPFYQWINPIFAGCGCFYP